MANETPKFTHDCDACIFLGRYVTNGLYTDDREEEVDLYVCPGGMLGPTIIARFGDEGHEYCSGLSFCDSAPHYAEACRRAINGGHLDENIESKAAVHAVDFFYTTAERHKLFDEGKVDEAFRMRRKTLAQLMDEYYGEGAWRESA